MKRYLYGHLIMMLTSLAACTSLPAPQPPDAAPLKVVTLDNTVKIVAGQTVYVPIYSHIYTVERSRTWDLTATLSVRNTELAHPIIVTSVNYYDTQGKLIRKYLEQPIELGSLSSTDFIVNQDDVSGGAGAAFIVEWVAQQKVSAPVIEAIMINTVGNQGISFVTSSRVLKSIN
ncbi:MAG: DUF3124 domain-containing protein [Drouetiella hepatica Uher 2000/2452]|jgi:hypothetical protein|uniref:DUF3124 domain-containing protein n=1 Tax=Drouetiella hepatica Uher 2000/2452 TaxID=904376 RepID=A0A951ULY6_9CYAN|nr:DUF3124 domain-containing protein [Drouetiella hepatica Uher 2000/2452]